MYTLKTFYKSKEWKSLTDILKLERTNDDGFIICEHCGKPIVKKYDIICHHKNYLTEQNVNDLNISLNRDNIALVHHSCHNDIHERFFSTSCRKVYIVYGSPLSGYEEFVKQNAGFGDLIINIDNIWKCLTGEDKIKPDRIKNNVFGVRDLLYEQAQYRVGKWNTCWIVAGLPFKGERERLQDRMGAELIFVDTSKEECLNNTLKIEDDIERENYITYINQWWKRYNNT